MIELAHINNLSQLYKIVVGEAQDEQVQSALHSLGISLPVQPVGKGFFATTFLDVNGNVLRISRSATDKFIDDMIDSSEYIPILSSEIIRIGDDGDKCYLSLTYRPNLESLPDVSIHFNIDDVIECPESFERMMSKEKLDLLVTHFEDSEHNVDYNATNPRMGDIIDTMFGFVAIPGRSSAYAENLRKYLQNGNVTTQEILNLHRQHFGFICENIITKAMFVGLLQFCKAVINAECRHLLTEILDAILFFEERIGFFPYDCKHDNLGVYEGKIVIRDYYYLRDAYDEIDSDVTRKFLQYKEQATTPEMRM